MNEFERLVKIIERLRNPKDGCPWDIKQTHRSLIPNFIEELYECIEAIENDDFEHLSEELGDLLLHIVMQAQIAKENDKFDIDSVSKKISDKLVLRHPHVFDKKNSISSEEVQKNWERIKLDEKKATRKSVIDGIPRAMPKLIVAQRMQEKAASIGFDWKAIEPVFEKLEEELQEFEEAYRENDMEAIQDEMGDLLFTLVNVSRKLGFDAESALNRTIKKFERRFKIVEKHYKNNKENMQEKTLEQLDEIWDIAKQGEKS
ncbi:MAG: nucleoside triphosphate pyrophosphohydrolase [Candidatus Cloacimonetes bacterium]|nr:nucleoside triphosphate pyrophosphohydrolase [Candidatus Cloacimonadota bacterium]